MYIDTSQYMHLELRFHEGLTSVTRRLAELCHQVNASTSNAFQFRKEKIKE